MRDVPRRAGRPDSAREVELRELEAYLRDGILDGRYVPGQRLVEIDLMHEFGASRWTVREALRCLEADGLVTIARNRGASVRRISRREVGDILDVLDHLSLYAIRRVAAAIADPRTRRLVRESRVATRRFRGAAAGQAQDYLYENARFWQSLTAAAGNPVLTELKFRLQMRLFCLQRQGLGVEATRRKWIHLHEDILTALLDGDGARAETLALEASSCVREAILQLPAVAFAPDTADAVAAPGGH